MRRIFIEIIKHIPIVGRIVNGIIYRFTNLNLKLEKEKLLLRLFVEMESGLNFLGQVDQDLLAYLFFKGRKDGFYIDIGANDGITINNTWVFEKLGWKGVCIEPLPAVFSKLQKNRQCDCYNVAIADKTESNVEFVCATGYSGDEAEFTEMLSGLNMEMDDKHKKRIKHKGGNIEYIKVKTLTFDDLMKNYGELTHIDFMSIDVEGAEMSILKTINFKKYNFGLITVENNEPDKGKGMIQFMKEHGYKVLIDLELDIVFVPKD